MVETIMMQEWLQFAGNSLFDLDEIPLDSFSNCVLDDLDVGSVFEDESAATDRNSSSVSEDLNVLISEKGCAISKRASEQFNNFQKR